MSLVFGLLYLVTWIFFILLLSRLVLDWIQVFSRDWSPKGPVLVAAELVFSATDPPIKALRRVVPPLRLGQIQLDLAFLIVMLGTILAMNVFGSLS